MTLEEIDKWKRCILEAIDPIEVVSPYIKRIRQTSNGYWCGECPFPHDSGPDYKRRFYMVIDSDKNYRWKCWRCGEAGDILDLVGRMQTIPFMEVLEQLAEKYGIERPGRSCQRDGTVSEREIQSFLLASTESFHRRLVGDKSSGIPPAESALSYLSDRGIDMDTIKRFKIGYVDHLPQEPPAGKRELLIASGFYGAKDNLAYPLIRDAIAVPIFKSKNVVNITFRRLGNLEYTDSEGRNRKKSKYHHLRSSKHPVNNAAGKSDTVFITEGPFDAITYEQHGFNAMGILGASSFTASTCSCLNREASIYLSLDTDEAGTSATRKIIGLLLAHGIWDIKVVEFNKLGENKVDANDYFKEHSVSDFTSKKDLEVKEAVVWYMDSLNLREPKTLNDTIYNTKKMRQLIDDVSCAAPIIRSIYGKAIADRIGVDTETISETMRNCVAFQEFTETFNQEAIWPQES